MDPQHNARRRRGLVAAHKACATTIEFWGCSLWEELSCRITEHFHLQLKYSPRKMRILWWKVSLLSSHSSHLPFLFSSLLCCLSALRSTRTVTLPSLKNGNEGWIKKRKVKEGAEETAEPYLSPLPVSPSWCLPEISSVECVCVHMLTWSTHLSDHVIHLLIAEACVSVCVRPSPTKAGLHHRVSLPSSFRGTSSVRSQLQPWHHAPCLKALAAKLIQF